MPYRRTSATEARRAEVRERIVAAAREQVAEGGYASASVQAVAARAGVATGSVYRHFPSKAELFTEVFRRASQRELDVMRAGRGAGLAGRAGGGGAGAGAPRHGKARRRGRGVRPPRARESDPRVRAS